MKVQVILKYIGLCLMVVSGFMFLSAAVAFFYGKDDGTVPLLISGILTGALGVFPSLFVKGSGKLEQSEGYWIVVGSWILACLSGTVPYIMYGGEFTVINALFESVSGFTTTGASILNDIEALPRSIQLWRFSSAWIGGIGIVTIFSLVMSSISGNAAKLTNVEISEVARGSVFARSKSFVLMMVTIYLILTVTCTLALKLCGLGWFDSVTHAMSACSTCGFSTRNASIAAFANPAAEYVLSLFMILASMKFVLLFAAVFHGKWGELWRSSVCRTYLFAILISACVICTGLLCSGTVSGAGSAFRQSLFQSASIFSTTGFATADTNLWPSLCKSVLVFASVICGCSGSTSGGFKMDRFVAAWKAMMLKIELLRSPNAVKQVKINNLVKSSREIEDILIYFFLYIAFICAAALVYAACGLDSETSWTASVACMGNVGPGFGEVGSMSNYSSLPVLAKWVSVALMLIGRLEILPILYVLRPRNYR